MAEFVIGAVVFAVGVLFGFGAATFRRFRFRFGQDDTQEDG